MSFHSTQTEALVRPLFAQHWALAATGESQQPPLFDGFCLLDGVSQDIVVSLQARCPDKQFHGGGEQLPGNLTELGENSGTSSMHVSMCIDGSLICMILAVGALQLEANAGILRPKDWVALHEAASNQKSTPVLGPTCASPRPCGDRWKNSVALASSKTLIPVLAVWLLGCWGKCLAENLESPASH